MKKIIGTLSLMTVGILSVSAHADIHYDSHGNVGYDTLAECQAAIKSGTAKFYESSTFKKPLLRGNEVAVSTGRLGDLAPQYRNGTCDIGTGHRGGRDGVAKAIQGKYIPYSPDMAINQYVDSSGNIVRVSMKQCDNWFSGAFPTGMPVPPPPKPAPIEPVAQPTPQPAPQPVPQPAAQSVPTAQPAPPPVPQPAPTPAVNAAFGDIPVWAPVAAAGIIGIAIAAGSDSDSSGSSGTTGTN